MNIQILMGIIVTHWFADFVIQTKWEAENKSKELSPLLFHTTKYSLIWLIVGVLIAGIAKDLGYEVLNMGDVLWFTFITFIFHTITDFVTSKIMISYINQGRMRAFFKMLGFDQVLHYIQLFLTYHFLTQ